MAATFEGKYTTDFLNQFTTILKMKYPAFDSNKFMSLIFDDHWEVEKFKQRIRHISLALRMTLPMSYRDALSILIEIAPKCRGVEYLFFPDFVEVNGLDDWNDSMIALEAFTQFSSSEFAVRSFILKDSQKMMDQMLKWASHPNHHIRRLASEGCRPRLPWASALETFKLNPSPIIPILNQLKQDASVYVQKSVANNLNDISKDHPELVKNLARKWHGEGLTTDWIIKHGCRGLLRKGDSEVLFLFGFETSPDVSVIDLSLEMDRLAIEQTLNFSFSVQTNTSAPQKLRVEYAIDFVKANGSTTRKLFKVTERIFEKESRQYKRSHSFKDLTTRKHYPGKHKLAVIINGQELSAAEFYVTNTRER
ncbi:DNA alkylation repair protein [Lysinibacillus pakistanensis]|uniref:DNA alkylation repair protein n=1 Tax=Lysinibacillus pakistanensis TaxID=759811 RepID=A0ABX6DBJ1_9BACI|nr:DNA alkylation repair protein [Lysinibacillus pakistanensis]